MTKPTFLWSRNENKLCNHGNNYGGYNIVFSDLSRRYREMESGNRMVIDNLKREKETMLARMEAMLSMLGGNLEKAIRALIQFARSICSTFTRTHKESIVPWLITGNDPKKQADFIKLFLFPKV